MDEMKKSSESAIKGKETILVVDDDQDIVKTIKGNLELDGYSVLCAFDGRSGLTMAKKHRPDLMILDLNLPDIDGIKVCQVIRREFEFPIIMLTAREAVSDRVLGLECGADDYVVKPFHSLELSARIKAILNRYKRSLLKDSYQQLDLSVNFKSKKVTVRGEEVELTKREYELLELFVSYPNEVLSREFIQEQVWRDSQLYKWSRVVDVHVQKLRKKIEADLKNPQHIVTVPGMGYKFEVGPPEEADTSRR